VSLPEAGREYNEAALRNVKSIFKPTFQGSGAKLEEKLVQSVFRTFTENWLERNMASKVWRERFERTIGKNPFFKQETGDTQGNSLIQSYSSFKAELAHINNPIELRIPGVAGGEGPSVLKIPATGMEYRPSIKVPGASNFRGIVENVFSRIMATKQILEVHMEYSRIPERENEIQHQKTHNTLTNNANQEAIIKRRENKQSVLKLLQNKDHFDVLSGKIHDPDRRTGAQELIKPAIPSTAQDYWSGYTKNRPPITHKSDESVSEKQLQQRKPVVKSPNTSTDSQTRTIYDRRVRGNRERLFERYFFKRITEGASRIITEGLRKVTKEIPRSITEGTPKSIISMNLSQSRDITEGNYYTSPDLHKSGSRPNREIAYYEAKEGIAPFELTPVSLPEAGREYNEAALRNVKSIFEQTLLGPGVKLSEKLVQNVFRTFILNRLERNLLAKERFERTIGKNPFFKQAAGDTQGNSLLESYPSFKAELAYIKNPLEPRISGGNGEEAPSVQNIQAAGLELGPGINVPGGSNYWRIAEKVHSRIMQEKENMEIHKREYSRILERENEIKPRRTPSDLTNISQEVIIKRRKNKQSGLKLLQNKDYIVLSGRINFQNKGVGALEFVLPALPSTTPDYASGYVKNMPPITHKSSEQVSEKQSQRKLVVKSLNTPLNSQTKTIKQSVSDVELMNPAVLSKLVDKVYSQLETRIVRERRRYGY